MSINNNEVRLAIYQNEGLNCLKHISNTDNLNSLDLVKDTCVRLKCPVIRSKMNCFHLHAIIQNEETYIFIGDDCYSVRTNDSAETDSSDEFLIEILSDEIVWIYLRDRLLQNIIYENTGNKHTRLNYYVDSKIEFIFTKWLEKGIFAIRYDGCKTISLVLVSNNVMHNICNTNPKDTYIINLEEDDPKTILHAMEYYFSGNPKLVDSKDKGELNATKIL